MRLAETQSGSFSVSNEGPTDASLPAYLFFSIAFLHYH